MKKSRGFGALGACPHWEHRDPGLTTRHTSRVTDQMDYGRVDGVSDSLPDGKIKDKTLARQGLHDWKKTNSPRGKFQSLRPSFWIGHQMSITKVMKSKREKQKSVTCRWKSQRVRQKPVAGMRRCSGKQSHPENFFLGRFSAGHVKS